MHAYIRQIFLALIDSFLRLVGGPEHLPAREFRQRDMQFEFQDQLLYLFMDVSELAITQFGHLGLAGDFVFDFGDVDDLVIEFGFVAGYPDLQALHRCNGECIVLYYRLLIYSGTFNLFPKLS